MNVSDITTDHSIQFLPGTSEKPEGFAYSVEKITEKAFLLSNGNWVPKSQISAEWVQEKNENYQQDTFMCSIPEWLYGKIKS